MMDYFPDVAERLTRRLIDVTLLRYQPEVGITYGNLGKCGCTTLKAAIWKKYDALTGQTTFPRNTKTIHQRKKDPFVNSLFDKGSYDFSAFRSSTFVTMVRNPFARILSGYLNKVGNELDPWVWTAMRNRYGLREGICQDDLSFLDFLRMIEAERPQHLDHHFMPLWIASAINHVPYNKVLHLERAEELQDYFAAFDIPIDYLAPHRTGADERLRRYYCDEAIEIVRRVYQRDFEMFGYDPNTLDHLEPSSDVKVTRQSPDVRDWIEQGTDVIDPESLSQDSRLMLQFTRVKYGKERKKKIALAYEGGLASDDWKRVRSYAHFLSVKGEQDKSDEIAQRLPALMNTHRARVSRQDLFAV